MSQTEEIECPRWVIRVSSPATPTDPRALLEIPAALQVNPKSAAPLRLLVQLGDREIEALFEELYDHRQASPETDLSITCFGHALHLNPAMQRDLESCLAALLIAYHDECPIESGPAEIIQ